MWAAWQDAAVPEANPAAETESKIMMSLSQGDDFRNTIVEQAKKTAQEKGATLDVYDEDGSLESQVEHIKQAAKENTM